MTQLILYSIAFIAMLVLTLSVGCSLLRTLCVKDKRSFKAFFPRFAILCGLAWGAYALFLELVACPFFFFFKFMLWLCVIVSTFTVGTALGAALLAYIHEEDEVMLFGKKYIIFFFILTYIGLIWLDYNLVAEILEITLTY